MPSEKAVSKVDRKEGKKRTLRKMEALPRMMRRMRSCRLLRVTCELGWNLGINVSESGSNVV